MNARNLLVFELGERKKKGIPFPSLPLQIKPGGIERAQRDPQPS
jgi:hypothetical protein